MATTSSNIETVIKKATRNELILQSIFQDLPIRELKICRQVCSKWNTFAMKEIRANNWNDRNTLNFDVRYDQRTFFESYLNLFRRSPETLPHACYNFRLCYPTLNVKDLVIEFCETFRKQIKGIDIRKWDPRHGVSPPAQDILEICGESLEELGISSDWHNGEYPPELRIKESPTNQILLPKLKSLSVDLEISIQYGGGKAETLLKCRRMFKNILSNMRPNSLEELNFHNFGHFHSAVEALIEFNQINRLEKLALYPNSNFQKGSLLIFKERGTNLRLKLLRIHNINPTFRNSIGNGRDIDPDELYDFLVTQKNSLQNLNLICSTYLFPSNMVAIKTLQIRTLKKELDANTIMINFAESFPNLRNLCLWNFWHRQRLAYWAGWDSDQEIISEQKPCHSVVKLTLPAELTLSVGPIFRILRTFPRLSSLEIKAISSEVFQTIWNSKEFADTLKVLILWIPGTPKGVPIFMKNALQLDEIFSGVSHQEIINATAEKYSEGLKLTESQLNSILKLKNLRKLHLNWIESRTGDQTHSLTDFVGFCIFDKMRNLIDLSVHQNIHKFSSSCIARLKANIMNLSCEQESEVHGNSRYKGGCGADYLKMRMSSRRMHL